MASNLTCRKQQEMSATILDMLSISQNGVLVEAPREFNRERDAAEFSQRVFGEIVDMALMVQSNDTRAPERASSGSLSSQH